MGEYKWAHDWAYRWFRLVHDGDADNDGIPDDVEAKRWLAEIAASPGGDEIVSPTDVKRVGIDDAKNNMKKCIEIGHKGHFKRWIIPRM
jgi:hypothetical protein